MDYFLDPGHWRGRHKARVFSSALGITAANADILSNALLEAAANKEAVSELAGEYGQQYVIEFSLTGPRGTVTIVSGWIIRTDEDFPRLTKCDVR